MAGRAIWYALGAGVSVWAAAKVRRSLGSATPQALGSKVSTTAAELTGSARDFVDRARAASAEREAELRDALGLPEPD